MNDKMIEKLLEEKVNKLDKDLESLGIEDYQKYKIKDIMVKMYKEYVYNCSNGWSSKYGSLLDIFIIICDLINKDLEEKIYSIKSDFMTGVEIVSCDYAIKELKKDIKSLKDKKQRYLERQKEKEESR